MKKSTFIEVTDQKKMQEQEPSAEELAELERMLETEEDKPEETVEAEDEPFTMEDCLSAFAKAVSEKQLLSAEEEKELGRQIAESENTETVLKARNKMVESNIRLAMKMARRYEGCGVETDDLVTMGIEGLIKAAEHFDYTLGYRFSTYATWWINQAMRRGIANEGGLVRRPVHVNEMVQKVRKVQKTLLQSNGCEPTVDEIAGYLGEPKSRVLAALEAMYTFVSVDTKMSEESDTTLLELLPDETTEDPCEGAMRTGLRDDMNSVLGQLETKEAMVLRLRYGIDRDRTMTLDEIAKLPGFGVTRERIRQLEERALRKIRRSPSMRNRLKDYVS